VLIKLASRELRVNGNLTERILPVPQDILDRLTDIAVLKLVHERPLEEVIETEKPVETAPLQKRVERAPTRAQCWPTRLHALLKKNAPANRGVCTSGTQEAIKNPCFHEPLGLSSV
jgi:hypothetical protein